MGRAQPLVICFGHRHAEALVPVAIGQHVRWQAGGSPCRVKWPSVATSVIQRQSTSGQGTPLPSRLRPGNWSAVLLQPRPELRVSVVRLQARLPSGANQSPSRALEDSVAALVRGYQRGARLARCASSAFVTSTQFIESAVVGTFPPPSAPLTRLTTWRARGEVHWATQGHHRTITGPPTWTPPQSPGEVCRRARTANLPRRDAPRRPRARRRPPPGTARGRRKHQSPRRLCPTQREARRGDAR